MNFALLNEQGLQLGFLLMVCDEANPQTGACLIRCMTEDENLIQTRSGQTLQNLHDLGELVWSFDGYKTILYDEDKQSIGEIKEHILVSQGCSYTLVDLTGNI